MLSCQAKESSPSSPFKSLSLNEGKWSASAPSKAVLRQSKNAQLKASLPSDAAVTRREGHQDCEADSSLPVSKLMPIVVLIAASFAAGYCHTAGASFITIMLWSIGAAAVVFSAWLAYTFIAGEKEQVARLAETKQLASQIIAVTSAHPFPPLSLMRLTGCLQDFDSDRLAETTQQAQAIIDQGSTNLADSSDGKAHLQAQVNAADEQPPKEQRAHVEERKKDIQAQANQMLEDSDSDSESNSD